MTTIYTCKHLLALSLPLELLAADLDTYKAVHRFVEALDLFGSLQNLARRGQITQIHHDRDCSSPQLARASTGIVATYRNVSCRINRKSSSGASSQISTRSAHPMRITKEELSTKVIVRRARRGTAPFIWEINTENRAEPIYVSPDAFGSMEDAYRAGQARLSEFVPSARSMAVPSGNQL
jgi:hypothetical protein